MGSESSTSESPIWRKVSKKPTVNEALTPPRSPNRVFELRLVFWRPFRGRSAVLQVRTFRHQLTSPFVSLVTRFLGGSMSTLRCSNTALPCNKGETNPVNKTPQPGDRDNCIGTRPVEPIGSLCRCKTLLLLARLKAPSCPRIRFEDYCRPRGFLAFLSQFTRRLTSS